MVKALLALIRLFVTVPMFELVGAGLTIAGVWLLTDVGWALIAGGACALLKSLDLAIAKDK